MSSSTIRTAIHKPRASSAVLPAAPLAALLVALLTALGGLCAALGIVAPAAAHAAYASSAPAFGEVLKAAPAQIELRFTQQLFRREGANQLRLERVGDSAAIALGDVTIDNTDRAAMRAQLLEPLPPGRYLVSWQNLSADDGDTDSGVYPFYVGVGPSAEEEAADRMLAAELLIAYPGDEPQDAAAAAAPEPSPPTVVRREAAPSGGIAASSIIWLAFGGVALAAVGASLRRFGRSP